MLDKSANFLFFFLIFLLGSCSYEQIKFKGVEDMSVSTIDNGSLTIALKARIENPNNYKIVLGTPKLEVLMGKQSIGAAKLKRSVKLKKKTEDVYEMNLEVSTLNSLSGIMSTLPSLMMGGASNMTVKGKMRARVFLFSQKFDFETSNNLLNSRNSLFK